ncbi:hypothetical protein VV02_02135 [Luteipulveratus mongoliensis]|uniref:YCII-related domain-containing protein n=2 Tax=Luteipulveratus mongoliensis TaxID=571913 RepID=A0A0K1JED0_9MICO|nr:hypothetical protein VV02_02135 [Luteipulveratus mongoliensis]
MFGSLQWDTLSTLEQQTYYDDHDAFATAVQNSDGCSIRCGEALASSESATVVRFPGEAQALTDGPYAEATEQLGGFYEVEVPSMDVLLGLVKLLPQSYTLEIRPVWEIPD